MKRVSNWYFAGLLQMKHQVSYQHIFLALLATLVMYLFLRSFRATLVGVMGIPICIIVAFLGLLLAGRTVNVISLAGIAFAIGMTIDNTIVSSRRHRPRHSSGGGGGGTGPFRRGAGVDARRRWRPGRWPAGADRRQPVAPPHHSGRLARAAGDHATSKLEHNASLNDVLVTSYLPLPSGEERKGRPDKDKGVTRMERRG